MLLTDDLHTLRLRKVWSDGRLVAENGAMLVAVRPGADAAPMRDSMRVAPLPDKAFDLRIPGRTARVIGLRPHSLITDHLERPVATDDGLFSYAKNPDLVKLAVLDRHKGNGKIGLGLLDASYGLAGGAIALSIAHDAHNIVVAGKNDTDMEAAVNAVIRMRGGIAMVMDGALLASLPLPVAGLMSDAPVLEVAEALRSLWKLSKSVYTISDQADAFMTLSFLALPVIPKLKLTVEGLFDVERFSIVGIGVS
jgi:adenine deaminase